MGMIQLPERSIRFFKDNLDDIFMSGSLAEGPWNKKLSEHTKKYTGADYAVPTISNGSGMMALLQLYVKFENRSEVILQSNTMYGVKTMVLSAGLNVVGYADCSMQTLMPTLDDIRRSVSRSSDYSKLILLLSHIGGVINPDIEEIADFCRKKSIVLLEDCAHSYGATLNAKHSGLFGDAGVYSFYATKAVPAGEGGIVITNNERIGTSLDDYIRYDRFSRKLDLGVNVRQPEIQALLIYAVTTEVEEIIGQKREIAKRYINACKELSIPFIDQESDGQRGNYYKFIVLSTERNIHDELPGLKTMTSKVYDYVLGNSEEIAQCHACLPIWYRLDPVVIDDVISELHSCRSRFVQSKNNAVAD